MTGRVYRSRRVPPVWRHRATRVGAVLALVGVLVLLILCVAGITGGAFVSWAPV